MKSSTKWIIGVVGLVICFYVGWFFPLLWMLWIISVVVLLVVPTKPGVPIARPYIPLQAPTTSVSSAAVSQIEAMIHAEKDVKVKEGLQRALAAVNAAQSKPIATQSMPVSAFSEEWAPVPQPVLTDEEREAEKKRQELRNINTILYTASFLLVGAAALFIGFSTLASPTFKFGTLLLAALGFYISGLILHQKSARLAPAATAFVGTGLALIPFVGLAFNSFVLQNAPLSWFLTSLFGLVAFIVAVSVIRSSVMAYLTLAFTFSLATSSAAVLDAPFLWYFVAIIVTGSLLSYVAYKLPNRVPQHFKKPLEENVQLATPVALVGSVLMAGTFTAFEYAMVTGVAALHYLVMTVIHGKTEHRFIYWTAARALTIIFATSLTYHFTQDWGWASLALLIAGVATHLYSIGLVRREPNETGWLWVAQALIAVSIAGWYDEPSFVSLTLGVLIVISLWQMHVMRRAEYAVAAVVGSIALLLSVFRGVIEPSVGYDIISVIAIILGGALLFSRWLATPRHVSYRQVLSLFYVSFIVLAIILAAISSNWIVFGSLMALAGVLLHVSSFIEHEETLTIGSNILLLVGVFTLYGQWFDSYTWVPLATGLTLGVAWYALSWYHRRPEAVASDDSLRSIIMSLSSIVVLSVASLIVMFQTDETVVAGALLGCLTAGVVAYEGFVRKQFIGYELAAYIATFSLQRLVAHVYPESDWLIYTHWWAFTGAAVAYLQYSRTGNKEQATVRAVLALTMFSLPTAFAALFDFDGSGVYKTVFLLEHVLLAVAGLTLNKKLAVRWGAIGVGLSVLYMLQGYTYLLLVLVALGLIALAVWRLNKKG